VECDPGHDPRGLGLALTLLWHMVESVRLGDDGALGLTFSGDARLLVGSHPDFESWNLHTPEGALLIAMPGGEMAIFPPVPGQAHGE
jgi:hypothetical protein